MSVYLSPLGGAGWQFFDANGNPLAGGLLYTYAAGTTTPQATYTTSAGTIANSNPIVLDSAGRIANQVWLTEGQAYKFELRTAAATLVWNKDNISGVNDIQFTQDGSTFVRSVQSKMSDVFSFEDFGAEGNNLADDTAEMQNAINYVSSIGGGTIFGVPGKTYRISAALVIKTGVMIDLCGALVAQATNNTPIFTAPTGSDITRWSIKNGRLAFVTQQTAAQTNGVGIRLAKGASSYNFVIDQIEVLDACDGIQCPSDANTFAFVGQISNFIGNDCARYSIAIDCDSAIGGNTNLVFTNCWALISTPADPVLATAKGFYFNACSMCQWQSLYADRIKGPFVFAQTCSGWFGVCTLEAAEISVGTSQSVALFHLVDTSVNVNTLKFVANDFKAWNQMVANITGTIAVGNTITGASSGATAKVRSVSGTGAGQTITFYEINGVTFTPAENIQVSGVTQGTVTSLPGSTGTIYLFRGVSSQYNRGFSVNLGQYSTSGNTYNTVLGGASPAIYDIVPTANVVATSGPYWVYNNEADVDRTSANLADFGTPKSIRYWDGDNRYYTLGMTADAAWDGNQTNLLSAAMNVANSYSTYSPTALDRNLRFKSTAYGNSRDGGLTLYSVDGGGVEQWITPALRLRSSGGGTPRLSQVAPDSGDGWEVLTTSAGTETRRLAVVQSGSVLAGQPAAIATNATDGFLYIPSCAGTPTGTPTAQTGLVPLVVNTTNNKLYFYSGGVWRDAGP